MRQPKPLTDEEGEVRELLLEDIKRFRPVGEVLSDASLAKLGLQRGDVLPPRAARRVTLQLSPDVIDRFRATGRGWQRRVDTALREWLESHPAE